MSLSRYGASTAVPSMAAITAAIVDLDVGEALGQPDVPVVVGDDEEPRAVGRQSSSSSQRTSCMPRPTGMRDDRQGFRQIS